jgi:predicted NUDIX family NTP pyrophosphohydrolase
LTGEVRGLASEDAGLFPFVRPRSAAPGRGCYKRGMPEKSAGLLLYRRTGGAGSIEVLLVHPGGPFWAKKDAAAWSIPKGLIGPNEDELAAARREFAEETGGEPPAGAYLALGAFRQPTGKIVTAFAVAADFDLAGFHSNTFTMEWPPRSGVLAEFPEADRAAWFALAEAEEKIHKGQRPILAALVAAIAAEEPPRP